MAFFSSPEIRATKILDTYVHQKHLSRTMKGTLKKECTMGNLTNLTVGRICDFG